MNSVVDDFLNDLVSVEELYKWTMEATSYETPKTDPIWSLHYAVIGFMNYEWPETIPQIKEECRKYLKASGL